MPDFMTELKDLNVHARELLEKYDNAFSKLDNLSKEKKEELLKLIAQKIKEIESIESNVDLEEIKKIIIASTVANALKLGGKSLEDIKRIISASTVANALKLGGKSLEEIVSVIISDSSPSDTNKIWFDTKERVLKIYDLKNKKWIPISTAAVPKSAIKTYTYGLSLLRSVQNADNIDHLFAQFKTIKAVWLHSKYQNYTTPKVEFENEDAAKFRFNRTTRWCTTNKTITGKANNSITFGWSNQGSSCYKGYFLYVNINGRITGLLHSCDCGNCGIYENQIYINGSRTCLGNSSNSNAYDVTIYVEGELNER